MNCILSEALSLKTPMKEKPLSQTITMSLNCLGFVPWLHDFEPVTAFLLHSIEAPAEELKMVDPREDCCIKIRYLHMVAMLSELFSG